MSAKDLFKICEECNNAIVCDANLNVIKTKEPKRIDWNSSIGQEAADKIFTTLVSLNDSETIRLNTEDKRVALYFLKSLAPKLDWCIGSCTSTGSKLKFDLIDDDYYGNSVLFETCTECKRTLVSKKNLWIIRGGVSLGFVATLGGAGFMLLPLLGFGASGVVAGSTAAAWQSSLGAVAAGSLFATLQSLGATGLGVLLFGGTGSALGLLSSLAVKLDWCTGDCTKEKETNATENENLQICDVVDDDFVKFRITVTKIGELKSLESPAFELGNEKWHIKVFKQSNHLGIAINSSGSCKIRGMVELIGINEKVKSIRQTFKQNVTATDGVSINEFVAWGNLFAQNTYIQRNSITIDVILRVENETDTPTLVECLICLGDIESQEISSVPCGHTFCTECIEKSLKLNAKCPLCDAAADINNLRRIQLPM